MVGWLRCQIGECYLCLFLPQPSAKYLFIATALENRLLTEVLAPLQERLRLIGPYSACRPSCDTGALMRRSGGLVSLPRRLHATLYWEEDSCMGLLVVLRGWAQRSER